MEKQDENSVVERNIELVKKLQATIIRCLRARGMPNHFRIALGKILKKLESFLEDPNSKTFLNNIGSMIEIIIKLMKILEILGK